jgi:uncharacterized tellurite resistance protein B-like protein
MSNGPLNIGATPKPKKGSWARLFGGGGKSATSNTARSGFMSNGILGGLGGLSATWSVEEAFIAVLYATAYVDGEVHPKELEEIKALGHRLKLFEKKTESEVDTIIDKVKTKLVWDRKSEFPFSQVDGACQAISRKDLGQTTFANAADIVFADRVIEQAEVDLLNRLASKLNIDSGIANRIVEVMQIKNGHNPG